MKLRTYHAYSMAEALAAVKRDLGADAVIMRTRSFRRGGFLGIGRRTVFEVTATAAAEANGEMAGGGATRAAPTLASRAARAYRATASPAPAASPGPPMSPTNDEPPTEADRLKTRRLAQAMLARHERQAAAGSAGAPAAGTAPAPAAPEPAPPEPARAVAPQHPLPEGQRSAPATAVARRFILQSPRSIAPAASIAAPSAVAAPGSAGPSSSDDGALEEAALVHNELTAIRSMVSEVLARQSRTVAPAATPGPGGNGADLPAALFEMYLALIGQEVSEELADRLVRAVRHELADAELDEPAKVREATLRHLAAFIPTAGELRVDRGADGRPLTIAMVGPTGVGKTTTLAKVAASCKLTHGRKVGLITADTYRIAAVEQLRTYANIIGLPLRVVLTPAEMRQAMHALRDCDVVLIDTAGRSQNDTKRIDELRAFMDAAQPHEIHLVLSSTAGERVLLREAEAFSVVGVDRIVLTKLDEAVSFGVLVNVMQRIGKSLSFVTTGQEVPDHLEVGRSDRLARLVLGTPAPRQGAQR